MSELPPIIPNPGATSSAPALSRHTALLARMSLICAAWFLGACMYFASVLDGFESLIVQPIIAAVVSAFGVGALALVGFLLRLSPLGRFWNAKWAVSLAVTSVFVLCFAKDLGMTCVYINPENQQPVTELHPAAAGYGYFGLLFAIANWPVRRANAV